jgi:hypothetical protein
MPDSVIQTLLQLPYLSGTGNKEIAPDTLVSDYLDEDSDAVQVWKDPICLTSSSTGEEKVKQQGYLSNAIPLTSCIGVNGSLLLLDLDSSMSLFSPSLLSSSILPSYLPKIIRIFSLDHSYASFLL